MGCKDDNTCDQPATKGEIETAVLVGGWFLAVSVFLAWVNNTQIQKMQSNTESIRQYGTIGGMSRGSLRDQHAIRELLDESPASRRKRIQWEKARQWDEIMDIAEEKEWLEKQEWYDGTNPYRD